MSERESPAERAKREWAATPWETLRGTWEIDRNETCILVRPSVEDRPSESATTIPPIERVDHLAVVRGLTPLAE